ncbi:MAG: hypothetical protein AAF152_02840 [Cyanobacteria bacterium P01_A01_bin.114]
MTSIHPRLFSNRLFPKRFWLALLAGLVTLMVGFGSAIAPLDSVPFGAAQAQPRVVIRQVEPAAIAAQIYEQYPDFPRENTYTYQANGEVAVDDTLVSRLIRYHLYVVLRPPNFRLDWKLTIADYLDAFDLIRVSTYPSVDVLSENPTLGDKAAIQSMTRQQRNQLSQTLFDLFVGSEPVAPPAEATPSGDTENVEQTTPSAADLLP